MPDRFLSAYYRLHPVNATFTGVHDYDSALPDWSPAGLEAAASEMRLLLGEQPGTTEGDDADLARGFLEIRLAEDAGTHGVRRNPALWTGEAVFGAIALMLRPSSPMRRRAVSVADRLGAVPAFLASAREALGAGPLPGPWVQRALRDCAGADLLLFGGIRRWVQWLPRSSTAGLNANLLAVTPDELSARVTAAADDARAAFAAFAEWLRARPVADDGSLACGAEHFDALLTRAHFTKRTRADLLAEARARLDEALPRLEETASAAAGTWAAARERILYAHPTAAEYLVSFERTWTQCRMKVERTDLVTWPNWPLRYVVQPEWANECAPHLRFLPYRSPAPEDAVRAHDYLVPPVDPADPERHLRAWNHAAIKLEHVVRNGCIGHHVRNWFAYNKCESRIGRIAGVDCASRTGMHCATTMTEGWAGYAADLMEEVGLYSPLDKAAHQHARVIILVRAIVDVELHQGTMSFTDAVQFQVERAGLSESAAEVDVTTISMSPGTGLAPWLGTTQIHLLRAEIKSRQGDAFSLKAFHEALLSNGSVPVSVAARRMLGS